MKLKDGPAAGREVSDNLRAPVALPTVVHCDRQSNVALAADAGGCYYLHIRTDVYDRHGDWRTSYTSLGLSDDD